MLDEVVVLSGAQLVARETVDDIRELHGVDMTTWMASLFKGEK
ncbi:hypothetical protein [Sporosarcina pasteurii]|nr:hypothetical protein [Sporosarcina pasteurii]MDS9471911.1 hypothetical protein [Sporosarcina pasteurii]